MTSGISISEGAIGTTIVGPSESGNAQSLGILVSSEVPGTKPFDVPESGSRSGQRGCHGGC